MGPILLSSFSHEFSLPLSNPVIVFLVLLTIVLLVTIILNRIRVPSIIGLIFAGIIIGPFGLNLISNDATMQMFSTIGLMYIMFTAGLELDFNDFRIHQTKVFFLGR
jgi:Kef-type K+ transport system membrane component KefB